MSKKYDSESTERDLILHLRIKSDDVGEKSIFKKRPSKLTTVIFSDASESDNECSHCAKKDKELKYLKQKLQGMEDTIQEHSILTSGNNLSDMGFTFIDKDTGKVVIPTKTDKPCRWCTCTFDTQPWFLPDVCYEEKYYIYPKIFCSPECGATYNRDFVGGYKTDDRHSLLQDIYQNVYNTEEALGYAPSDIGILEKYGGNVKIDEFRGVSKHKNRNIRVVMPPLIPIVGKIEHRVKTNNIKYEGLGSDKNLILFRSKPLPNAGNTLEQAGLITRLR